MREMTNKETAQHIREWVNSPYNARPFSWPTDGCGYKQHIRFVEHRNKNWHGDGMDEFNRFVLDYADAIESEA